MNRKIQLLLLTGVIVLAGISCVRENEPGSPVLKGPYLGQKPPGMKPELFAPGIITTRFHEHSAPALSPSGDEIFWSVFLAPLQSGAPQVILTSRLEEGKWIPPEVASFSGRYNDGSPRFSQDGRQLYFDSARPLSGEGEPKDEDIWVVEKTEKGWGEARNLGAPVNSEKMEAMPTVTASGTLYFIGYAEGHLYDLGIYVSRLVNGRFTKPMFLPEVINSKETFDWCPFIAPDESFLLFSSGREGGLGAGDIYVSFRQRDDSWTQPKNLGSPVNSDDNDRFPAISPDGRILFFASKRQAFGSYHENRRSFPELIAMYSQPGNGLTDIYWVDAKIIDKFKPEELD